MPALFPAPSMDQCLVLVGQQNGEGTGTDAAVPGLLAPSSGVSASAVLQPPQRLYPSSCLTRGSVLLYVGSGWWGLCFNLPVMPRGTKRVFGDTEAALLSIAPGHSRAWLSQSHPAQSRAGSRGSQ